MSGAIAPKAHAPKAHNENKNESPDWDEKARDEARRIDGIPTSKVIAESEEHLGIPELKIKARS